MSNQRNRTSDSSNQSRQEDVASDLAVIGAGMGRTGTESLKTALEMLMGGGAKCYHMFELASFQPDDCQRWVEVDRAIAEESGDEFDVVKVKQLFNEIFHSKYKATVDCPSASYYKQLCKVYPKAKVILTVRDPASWVRSVRQTILIPPDWAKKAALAIMLHPSYMDMQDRMLARVFGSKPIVYEFDDSQLAEAFNAWNESVKSTISSDRLLVFDVKQGWEPLCSFLNLPIPSNQPFPHANSSQVFIDRFTKLRRLSQAIRYGLPLLLGISVATILGMLKSLI